MQTTWQHFDKKLWGTHCISWYLYTGSRFKAPLLNYHPSQIVMSIFVDVLWSPWGLKTSAMWLPKNVIVTHWEHKVLVCCPLCWKFCEMWFGWSKNESQRAKGATICFCMRLELSQKESSSNSVLVSTFRNTRLKVNCHVKMQQLDLARESFHSLHRAIIFSDVDQCNYQNQTLTWVTWDCLRTFYWISHSFPEMGTNLENPPWNLKYVATQK